MEDDDKNRLILKLAKNFDMDELTSEEYDFVVELINKGDLNEQ